MKYRKFGIEFEMSTNLHTVDPILKKIIPKNKYLMTTSSDKSTGKYWHLKKDYSTESELATPILSFHDKDGIPLLKKILKTLVNKKIKITKDDGLHVHVDCKDLEWNKILIAWIYLEESIKKLFPKHRTRNRYRNVSYSEPFLCKKNKKIIAEYFKKMKVKSNEHHAAINFQYFEERGTVEFRWHEGALDYHEIMCWIKFIHCFLEYSKNVNLTEALCSKVKDFDCCELINLIDIVDKDVIEWVKDRYDKFYK